MKVKCPKCGTILIEHQPDGPGIDWWECTKCQVWVPGAHLRSRGLLGKNSGPKRKSRKKKGLKITKQGNVTTISVDDESEPKPTPKSQPKKGIRHRRVRL